MTIHIKRNLVKGEVTEGKLYIDDIFICDTLEKLPFLPPCWLLSYQHHEVQAVQAQCDLRGVGC